MDEIPNILAQRYASQAMRDIWSPTGRVVLERELWLSVLRAQREMGMEIAQAAIDAYAKVLNQVDLDSINRREAVTRHDVKARIEEFCALAGHEDIHRGMTSRDLTENVEQLQVLRSLELVRERVVSSLIVLARRAGETRSLVVTGRTHNVPAQNTTVGKRLAMFGEELLRALEGLDYLLQTYPVRGLKGAVGTQLDALSLFDGDSGKVAALEEAVMHGLGFQREWVNVGQVYPRSLDLEVVSALNQLAAAPGSFAKTLRLMAGHELAGEGFLPGQVGSSAMPHKMNSRSCERINGFQTILRGHLTMVSSLAGDQWNEGDVSCSVVRRVVLPDAFFTIDGLLETFNTVLRQMEVNDRAIERENARYLPFLLTTSVLMRAVRGGVGRETAHEAIKEHALATVRDLREGKVMSNDLMDRLAADPRLGLKREELASLEKNMAAETGMAATQVDRFIAAVEPWKARFPNALSYRPADIL